MILFDNSAAGWLAASMKSAFCSSRIFIVTWLAIFNLNLSAAQHSPREHLLPTPAGNFISAMTGRMHCASTRAGPVAARLRRNSTTPPGAASACRTTGRLNCRLIKTPTPATASSRSDRVPKNSVGWYRRTFDLPAEDSASASGSRSTACFATRRSGSTAGS